MASTLKAKLSAISAAKNMSSMTPLNIELYMLMQ